MTDQPVVVVVQTPAAAAAAAASSASSDARPVATATTAAGCGQWYLSEVVCSQCCTDGPTATWFGAVDVVNGKTIDIPASFQLEAPPLILFFKFLLWGLTVGSFAYGWVDYAYPYWFMAYISYWTMFYSCIYTTLSLVTSYVVYLPTRGAANDPSIDLPNGWIKATWIMYLVAAVHGIMVFLLFWITEYSPETHSITYFTIASHGLSVAATMVDGLVVNKIPVRLVHCVFCMFFGLLFIAWSIVQGLIPIDNPNKDYNAADADGDTDESLYSILDWMDEPLASAIVSVMVIFVAFPILTLAFWGLSLWGRRYVRVPLAETNEAPVGEAAAVVDADNKGDQSNSSLDSGDETEDVEAQQPY